MVFSAPELLHAKVAEDILKQNGIISLIVNQPDSMFPALTETQLYTTPENAQAALQVLRENELIEPEKTL